MKVSDADRQPRTDLRPGDVVICGDTFDPDETADHCAAHEVTPELSIEDLLQGLA